MAGEPNVAECAIYLLRKENAYWFRTKGLQYLRFLYQQCPVFPFTYFLSLRIHKRAWLYEL